MAASIQQLYPVEAQRLSALRRYDILDTPPEAMFDKITAIAARLLSVPMAVISLVDENRIWFKSHHGLEINEIARDPGLCASAILQQEPWVLVDAQQDVRSRANPLVTGEFGLRFYVGIPLRTQDGYNLGTLSVLDKVPHPVTEQQIADLKHLAGIVMDQMELRLSARRAVAGVARLAGEREAVIELARLTTQEFDHRIKSSLDLVSALLRLQSRSIEDGQCAEQLKIAINRVATISRAHQHIAIADGAGVINGSRYLGHLTDDLWKVIGTDQVKEIAVEGVPLSVSPDQVIAVGLIVNELISNAAKHGATQIKVRVEEQPAGCTLSVMDNGAGLPAGFDPECSTGLGMKIIGAQTRFLGGHLSSGQADGASGARFTICFPAAGRLNTAASDPSH